MSQATTAAVIVAAGRGNRAGGDQPKQWQEVAGRRVLDWTIDRFLHHSSISHCVVVLHPDDVDRLERDDVMTALGGSTRDQSVKHGLIALEQVSPEFVLIHDVARPCVPDHVITSVIEALESNEGAAPALPVSDALWVGQDGYVADTRDRTDLFRAQTPQGFHFDRILTAHMARTQPAADDVEVARDAGLSVRIVPGSEDNLKITYPHDFVRAEKILMGV